MGFFDRLFGRTDVLQVPAGRSGAVTAYAPARRTTAPGPPQDSTTGASAEDQAAIARYRYLLRTAPPERIEQVHAEAFARLTPQQRQAILAEMTRSLPPEEVPRVDEPQAMARAATRAEMAQPGYLQNTFGRTGVGLGGMFAGSMLGTIAGVVVGSALADVLLGGFEHSPEAAEAASEAPEVTDPAAAEAGSADEPAAQTDTGGDVAAADQGWGDVPADPGGDLGADFSGDFVSDFGGDFF